MIYGIWNYLPSMETIRNIPTKIVEFSKSERLSNVVNYVALAAFHLYVGKLACNPWIYSLVIPGWIFQDEIDQRITKPLGEMMRARRWEWLLPAAAVLHWLYMPGLLPALGVLFGAQAGSLLCLRLRGKVDSLNGVPSSP